MLALNANNKERIYQRALPGGGFVSIDVRPMRTLFGPRRYRGSLIVERRGTAGRRDGHVAPVVAETKAATISSILHDLFPLAQSNIELANRCLALCRPVPVPLPSPATWVI